MILHNIQALCKENGISVWALEKATGMSQGSIRKWAVSSPSVVNIKAVADYFGMTIDELLKDNKEG